MMNNKLNDLKRLQEIQQKYLGILDIQIATRIDIQKTLIAITNYPVSRKYYVHRLDWIRDNTKEFKIIEEEIKKFINI